MAARHGGITCKLRRASAVAPVQEAEAAAASSGLVRRRLVGVLWLGCGGSTQQSPCPDGVKVPLPRWRAAVLDSSPAVVNGTLGFLLRHLKFTSEIHSRLSDLLMTATPRSKGDTPLHCTARAAEHSDGHPPHETLQSAPL